MSRRAARSEHSADGAPVYRITGAAPGTTADVNARARRYLISMGIRTVCFVLAIFIGGPMRWVLIAAALVLPYFSVVFANAGRERAGEPPDTVIPPGRPELPPPSQGLPPSER